MANLSRPKYCLLYAVMAFLLLSFLAANTILVPGAQAQTPVPTPTAMASNQPEDLSIKDILNIRDLGLLVAVIVVQVIGAVVGVYLLRTAAAKEDLLKTTYEQKIVIMEERLTLADDKAKPLQELLEERSKLLQAREEELARAKGVLETEREILRRERERLVPAEPTVARREISLAPEDRQRLDELTRRIDGIEQLSIPRVFEPTAITQLKSASDYFSDGYTYQTLERYDEAIAAYQRAIALDPNVAGYHNNLGNVYHDLGQHEQAIAAYQKAIELDPNDADYHNNLGAVYAELGRHEEAIAAFQRAIELDPTNATPYVGLAGVSRRTGDAEGLERYVTEARRLLKPDDHSNLACLESIVGNIDAALAHLARALEKAPGTRAWARRDPDLAFIRDDPRFRELVGWDDDIA